MTAPAPFRESKPGGVVCFSLREGATCPCGSGVVLPGCCLTPSGLHKPPGITAPPQPRTGGSNPRCYASPLGDCDSDLSREHPVSASLLEHIEPPGGLLVGGVPWLRGETKALRPAALASRILCRRHNSALSPLDASAVKFFNAFHEDESANLPPRILHLLSGHDLERWLLKVLCGMAAGNSLALTNDVDGSIPREWLEVLFGERTFEREQGLYVCSQTGYEFRGRKGLKVRAIARSNRLSGMGAWFSGYELVLSMGGLPARVFDGRRMTYRPCELNVVDDKFEKSVLLCWDGPADLGTIHVRTNGARGAPEDESAE